MNFFNFRRAGKSFIYAFRGLRSVWKKEQNFRFHLIAAILVLISAIFLQMSREDFLFLLILICSVLILELVNTVFERLIDILKPRIHEYSKEIKNISSSIVLLAAIFSVLSGIIIFYPYICEFFQ
ncbi:diacylglycerol kinase family protein [Candidatus Parcubacteria bacterium]|nr:diacylglycerol kinase family protein [Candidatus Parcubacteria bacterium]